MNDLINNQFLRISEEILQFVSLERYLEELNRQVKRLTPDEEIITALIETQINLINDIS